VSRRIGWYVGAGACLGTSILLSQVRFKEEREFPGAFGELESEEHGHEKGLEAATEFFGVREQARRLMSLFLGLGVLLALRGQFSSR
jgi:hypothetical protein